MKRCPTCDQLYEYQLRFCRFDGSPLNNTTWRDAPTMLLEPDQHLAEDLISQDLQDYSGYTGLDM